MLEQSYQEPFTTWQSEQSPANMGVLLRAVDPVIKSAMRTYAGAGARSVNTKSQAKMMAADAFKSYDPARGKLKTHLMSRLQRLRRTAAQQRQIIGVPEQVSLDQTRSTEAANELEDRLGRKPSDSELADHTGLSMKRLGYIRSGGGRPVAESTISRMGAGGTGGYDPGVRDLGEKADPWVEFVYDDLESTNQFILERVLGLHGHKPMSPTQVAAALKISPPAVTYRMKHIQEKLDKREELGMF